jgi:hypothetical protein
MIKELEKRDIVLQKITNKSEIFGLISKLHPLKSNARLIRVGPNGDGGYLVPDDLVNIEACFSPGVDAVSQFEYDCYNRGMKIFMADNSVKKPN